MLTAREWHFLKKTVDKQKKSLPYFGITNHYFCFKTKSKKYGKDKLK